MKAKVKKSKTTKVTEQDIPQLSGSTIIQKRIKKCVEELGMFKPEEICTKCRFCEHYMVAKTPLNSKYRQMDAWESYVAEHCPCEYLNGIENENGEVEVIKPNQDASECENFKLAMQRVPKELLDIVNKARTSDSISASDNGVREAKKELTEDIADIDNQIEQFKLKITELKSKREDLESEVEQCYLNRFNEIDEIVSKNALGFASIMGKITYDEDLKQEKDNEKLISLGFQPHQKKVFTLTISPAQIADIQRRSKDITYGGFFTNKNEQGLQIDILGKTLSDYAGQSFEFETELTEVAKSKGFRKQVIFQETEENFVKRQGISILELVCGKNKMRWREDVQVPATIENLNEVEETEDEEGLEETDD